MKLKKKTKKTLTTVAVGIGVLGIGYLLYQRSGLWRENRNTTGAYTLNRVGAYTMRRSNMGVYTAKPLY